ncbi:MAG: hypothetical protein ACT4P4_22205 [Betaproteobacteria bacterium]
MSFRAHRARVLSERAMRILLLLAASVIAATAAAQPEGRRKATDPEAPVQPVQYRSAFADYKPFREPEAANWRDVNDEVRGLGGHMGHAGKPKPPGAKQESGQQPQRAAPGGHGAHK